MAEIPHQNPSAFCQEFTSHYMLMEINYCVDFQLFSQKKKQNTEKLIDADSTYETASDRQDVG